MIRIVIEVVLDTNVKVKKRMCATYEIFFRCIWKEQRNGDAFEFDLSNTISILDLITKPKFFTHHRCNPEVPEGEGASREKQVSWSTQAAQILHPNYVICLPARRYIITVAKSYLLELNY